MKERSIAGRYAIKVVKRRKCSLILLSGRSMKVRVFGKRENKREKKLEVLCIVTINVLENMNAKEETDFKDL